MIWYLPFILQGAAMIWDELYFHSKRGLGRWERWGHPIDTISVLIPTSITLKFPFNETFESLFIILAVLSCLIVTKDEFVHSKECEPAEQWLHSVLFILHPFVFLSLWWFWRSHETTALLVALIAQAALLTYQVGRWILFWEKKS